MLIMLITKRKLIKMSFSNFNELKMCCNLDQNKEHTSLIHAHLYFQKINYSFEKIVSSF